MCFMLARIYFQFTLLLPNVLARFIPTRNQQLTLQNKVIHKNLKKIMCLALRGGFLSYIQIIRSVFNLKGTR